MTDIDLGIYIINFFVFNALFFLKINMFSLKTRYTQFQGAILIQQKTLSSSQVLANTKTSLIVHGL